MKLIERINSTVKFLNERGFDNPEIGIILGTGLGSLVDQIEVEKEITYTNIPNFPIATVEFHKGKLIFGKLEGKTIVAMQGRFHYYEGHSIEDVVFPVRVMQRLGIQKLLISNACGCMNLDWKKGELMLIDDHINLQPESPLRGREAPLLGPIFTDMSAPYDTELNAKLSAIAAAEGITLHKGTYVAVTGPQLETRAEYRYLRMIGADVVGMSTVPEVIAANQMGLPVAAISVLTDECDPDNLHPVDIDDIIATAKAAEKDLVVLLRKLMNEI